MHNILYPGLEENNGQYKCTILKISILPVILLVPMTVYIVRYNICKNSYNKTVEILYNTKSNNNTVNHRPMVLFLVRLYEKKIVRISRNAHTAWSNIIYIISYYV